MWECICDWLRSHSASMYFLKLQNEILKSTSFFGQIWFSFACFWQFRGNLFSKNREGIMQNLGAQSQFSDIGSGEELQMAPNVSPTSLYAFQIWNFQFHWSTQQLVFASNLSFSIHCVSFFTHNFELSNRFMALLFMIWAALFLYGRGKKS